MHGYPVEHPQTKPFGHPRDLRILQFCKVSFFSFIYAIDDIEFNSDVNAKQFCTYKKFN